MHYNIGYSPQQYIWSAFHRREEDAAATATATAFDSATATTATVNATATTATTDSAVNAANNAAHNSNAAAGPDGNLKLRQYNQY